MLIDAIKILFTSPVDFLNLIKRSLKSKFFNTFYLLDEKSQNGKLCNICNHKFKQFMSDKWHKNIICPNCYSDIRHRLFFQIISEKNLINYNDKNGFILHFAPEKILYKFLKKSVKEGKYLTADLMTYADLKVDICNMKEIKSSSVSCLIAIDVLEHVSSLEQALSETNRVLKKDGVVIFSFPTIDGISKTIDNKERPLTTRERLIKFGQIDHNRLIGEDIIVKFKSFNFYTDVYDYSHFDEKTQNLHILKPDKPSLKKFATNNRKIFILKKII